MKNLLSIAVVGLTLAACSNNVVTKSVPPPEQGTQGTEPPADGTTPPDDGTTTPQATDPCACPNTCASETEPKKMVCHPAPAPAELPAGENIGRFQITGYEYWQWKKPDPYDGGNEVAWGYNGDGEPKTGVKPTDKSRACMAEARKVLVDILTNDVPAELEAFRAKYRIKAFWQWNNDMTDTKPNVEVPDEYQSLWLYDGRLIKWMSHTERDGSCRLPTRADLVKFATGCMAEMDRNAGKSKGCYNSSF